MEHLYIIADTDSCDELPHSVCSTCPLARLKKRGDGEYMSCADAVDFKSRGDGSYSKAAISAIIESILEVDQDESNRDGEEHNSKSERERRGEDEGDN